MKAIARLALMAWLAGPAIAWSESRDARGPILRAGLGGAHGALTVANEQATRLGLVGSLQGGVSLRRVGLILDLTYQPFAIRNPLRAESLSTALFLLPSVELTQGRGYARAGIGFSRASYSGPDVFVPTDTTLGFGAALGYGFRKPLALEIAARWSASSDGELSHRLITLHLVYVWRQGPR